jgi:tetratricopeptide (TPR) repeat protein
LRRWAALLAVLTFLGLAGWLGGRHLWAQHHLRAAEQALGRYDFPEALDHLERCLRFWPNDGRTRLLAAGAARRADLLERAEEHLGQCESAGVTPETTLERAMLRAQQGDLADVELPLQRLIREEHADTVPIIEALAQGYLQVARVGHAQRALDDLLKHAPGHPWAHFWRGKAHELSNTAQALADYREAARLAPHRAVFRLRLAQVLLLTSRPAEARPHFEQLLRDSPTDADVLLGAARCLRELGEPARALEYSDTLLRDHPDHAEAWAERGRACSDQGNAGEALRCLRRAFELNPHSYPIAFALFVELRGQGNTQQARVISQRAEALKRDEDRLLELMRRNGTQPRPSAAVRHEIATILQRTGAEAVALRWFLAALQADPNHRPTHEALAEWYQRQGNAEEAAYHRDRAGRSGP